LLSTKQSPTGGRRIGTEEASSFDLILKEVREQSDKVEVHWMIKKL
jgi:hypothetical protein